MKNLEFAVIGYYKLFNLKDTSSEILFHKNLMLNLSGMCRIYISETGINAQLSIPKENLDCYIKSLNSHYGNNFLDVKVDLWNEHVFPRLTVKYRKELVAINCEFDVNSHYAKHLNANAWDKMLENGREKILIDARNSYEWQVGHFLGFDDPGVNSFRDFRGLINDLKDQQHFESDVMMYCTGGIRCEVLSRIMSKEGFTNLYQLDGGVVKYGKEGGKFWKGKLFVFDDRICVDISKNKSEDISHCFFCGKTSSVYYNCANMDCNDLFISCHECVKLNIGCCREDCKTSKRLRSVDEFKPHKPFRKKHYLQNNAGGRT